MDERLAWYRALRPEDRSWVGMIAQAGIAAFVNWYRRPSDPVQLTADVFGAAPRELTRSISLGQTLDLLRTVVDVVEEQASLHAVPGAQQAVREAVLRFSRDVAFAAAEIYAQAAEARGAWDARLEALVVDALVRGEPDDALHSRAAALGWAEADRVAVVAGHLPPSARHSSAATGDVIADVRRAARRHGSDALVGVQADRIVVVLGRSEHPMVAAEDVAALMADGPVVTGPVAATLGQASGAARAAIAGLAAARARPDVPRPVAADELLPERVLTGDLIARQVLIEQGYLPLAQAPSRELLTTASTYLALGRSVEGTARRLFVHPNTVRYRLRRVADLTGWDPTDPRDAYVLEVAIGLGRLE
jgi:DNA-binding PucR family transcriptional regulator